MTSYLTPLLQRRTYLETFDLLLDLVVGTLWFTVFVTLIATGASLLFTLVGLPILTATFYLARAVAHTERARARAFLDADIEASLHEPAKSNGLWHRLIAPFDGATWRELLYIGLVQPVLAVVNFSAAVVVWAVPLYAITLPIYATYAAPELWNGHRVDAWNEILPLAIAGLVVLPLVPRIIHAFAKADAAAARWGVA